MNELLHEFCDNLAKLVPPVIFDLESPVSSDEVDKAERDIGNRFPSDFLDFLRFGNGQVIVPVGKWYNYTGEQVIPSIDYASLGYSPRDPSFSTAAGWLESACHVAQNTLAFRAKYVEWLNEVQFECYGPARLHNKYISITFTENSSTLLLDMAPADGGTVGQVVSLDDSGSHLCVVAKSFYDFIGMLNHGFSQGLYTKPYVNHVWMSRRPGQKMEEQG